MTRRRRVGADESVRFDVAAFVREAADDLAGDDALDTLERAGQLGQRALATFADGWLAEGPATSPGTLTARRGDCSESGQSHDGCCRPALERAIEVARGARHDEERRTLSIEFHERERVTLTLWLYRDESSVPFAQADQAVAMALGVAQDQALERRRVANSSRDAVRRTQRIASQLHELFAAALATRGLRDDVEIVDRLASATRSVFDADEVVVVLESGPFAPLRASSRRRVGTVVDRRRLDERDRWRNEGWHVAPIFERRDVARGLVAVTRAAPFAEEDTEVLALLAQMAAASIGAAELARAIESSEARLRVLIESAPVGLVECDRGGRVAWWNRAASRVFNWPAPTENTPGAVGFPEAMGEGLSELWSRARAGDGAATQDFVDVTIGSGAKVLSVSAAALPTLDGQEGGVLTLVDDVTGQRELESQIRHAHTMELRGQIASNIAHDFNNLLTLITGYGELLALDLEGEERALTLVHDIQVTASRASLLTSQLQSIGRTKATTPVAFEPLSVLASNIEVIERVLGAAVVLHWSLDDGAGAVHADPDQFEQLLLNLVLNARDAMTEGGELHLELDQIDVEESTGDLAEGRYVRLVVRDTGVGMDAATLARCFEPLFTTKGPYKGTGLGLAAARRFVTESAGAIRADSTPGAGSTFEVLLPAHDAVALPDVAPAVRRRQSASILLVEDDDAQRRLMARVLVHNGFAVTEAESSEAALQIVRDGTIVFDLLVSDVLMGAMNGALLARELQGLERTHRVLLVSGTEDASVLAELDEPRAFLRKPFKPSELIDRVDTLLARAARR